MNHYTAGQWSDYVRRLGAGTEREQMRSHLESGCPQCRGTVAWLENLVEMAGFEAKFEPPIEEVTQASGIFQPSESEGWKDRLQQIAAKLVLETPHDWQPAGVRSMAAQGVRLLFRAGDYSVDLKIEPSGADGATEIIGQITNEVDPQEQLGGLAVQIVDRRRAVAETKTNQFGEFVIARPGRRKVILRISLERTAKRIDLLLQNQIVDHS
jgi:hypothetical protein